jgi:hypothetical protein
MAEQGVVNRPHIEIEAWAEALENIPSVRIQNARF